MKQKTLEESYRDKSNVRFLEVVCKNNALSCKILQDIL